MIVTNFGSIFLCNFIEHKLVNDLLTNLDCSLLLHDLFEQISRHDFGDDGDWADDVNFYLLDHHFNYQFTLFDALSIIEDRYQCVMVCKLILIILLLVIINLLAIGTTWLARHVPLASFISLRLPCLSFLAIVAVTREVVLPVLALVALAGLTELTHASMSHSDDAELAKDELIESLVLIGCSRMLDVDIHLFFEEFI